MMSNSVRPFQFLDLYLDVGQPAQRIVVSSHLMARASPAFQMMLFGHDNFLEAQPEEGQWIVGLPADDPTAFRMLVKIIHLPVTSSGTPTPFGHSVGVHVGDVPMDLVAAEGNRHKAAVLVYNTANLANKYLLMHLLWPWVDFWLRPWRPDVRINPTHLNGGWLGEVLAAAWFFGDEEIVKDQLDKATLTMRFRGQATNGRGWICDNQGNEWRLGAMPEGPNEIIDIEHFSDTIMETRQRLLDEMCQSYRRLYHDVNIVFPLATPTDVALYRHILDTASYAANPGLQFRPWSDGATRDYKGTVNDLLDLLRNLAPAAWDTLHHERLRRQASHDRVHWMLKTQLERPLSSVHWLWNGRPFVLLTDEQERSLGQRKMFPQPCPCDGDDQNSAHAQIMRD